MTNRERVLAAVAGKPVDYVPAGFWIHFPEDCMETEKAIQAHLDYFEKTGTSIMKIMNENLVPCDIPIRQASDWKNLKAFNKNSKFIKDQLEIVKRILDKTHDKGVTLLTVHGIVASAWHARGGSAGYETGSQLLVNHLREDPAAVQYGYEVISDALAILTEEAIAAGIDGIYYAALGGEEYLYTDEEFDKFVKPNDLKILNAAKNRSCFNILHMCKDRLKLERYKDYPADVVNWGVYEQNPSLEEGKKIFHNAAILGGLDDRAGVLVDGTKEEIEKEIFSILDRMGSHKFLLGADCTLPTEISYEKIKAAVMAPKKYIER